MFLKDLIISRADHGKISSTKFWSNIGMLSMTIIFLQYGFKETLPEWYMWVYAAAVTSPQLLSKLMSLRWGMVEQQNKDRESDDTQQRQK